MLDTVDVIVRLVLAVMAGAVLGWERESRQKPAGLRTHMLVSLGAASFMVSGLQLHHELVAAGEAGGADLLKVLGGIVGGVGFLGAGSIIRSEGAVYGLTTVATIWLSAAIGVACGLGHYVVAAVCVGLAVVILLALGLLERSVFGPSPQPPSPPAASEAKDSNLAA